ncbi:AAA family ATPase [Mariniblastus fucicola]|uniref:ATPase family associated with various cellular activities (AAA) n=1 Tax=Mariniblastus fucicola TaxID=980251 RepID=A0A5B9PIM5_9BACT|nr:MoxR family ATPase [Mariniblastus fucicola]QEG22473.1 ATPase family associated with various cellular activities (AAA) [Mariniblastus fucicola]
MSDHANGKIMVGDDDLEILKQASEGYEKLRQEIGKVIVGQDSIVRPALAAVFCQGHTLIIGVPGLAKTLLVRTLAESLNWMFKRIQFTPDLMPSDIIGMELLQENAETGEREMKFVRGPIFGNVILADEINRTPPKTQSALLEAMQEYTVTSMGRQHRLEKPFVVFATQNPIEQEGTYPLPEAQLDRFMFSLWVEYPTAEQEEEIVFSTTDARDIKVEPVFTLEQIQAFQNLVRRVPVSRHAVKYAVALARATRPGSKDADDFVNNYVSWGAGPRAGQNLVLGAKALAVIDGQPAVSSAHVREAAKWVLRHRILPNYNAAGEGIRDADIVDHVLKQTREPSYERSSSV